VAGQSDIADCLARRSTYRRNTNERAAWNSRVETSYPRFTLDNVRCSNICARKTPSPIIRSKALNVQGRKAAKARRQPSATIRRASCSMHRRTTRSRASVTAPYYPRCSSMRCARGIVQAQGQRLPACTEGSPASQGVRQRRQDAVCAAASRHPCADPRLPRRRRSCRR
jgi:hypothetical protein